MPAEPARHSSAVGPVADVATASAGKARWGGSWYLRAGPGGVAYRIPGRARWRSLLFGQSVVEGALPWERVARWYPYVHTMNGIPTASLIVLECKDGGAVRVGTIYFAESRARIGENLTTASRA